MTKPWSFAVSTISEVMPVMPSTWTSSIVTGAWKAREERIAALAAAS